MKKTTIALALLCSLAACKKNDTPVTPAIPNVYVAGYETNANNLRIAKYWKNGVAVTLSDGTKDVIATSIAVIGNDVYVSGTDFGLAYSGPSKAVYWKNGVIIYLTDASTFNVTTGIAVDDMNNVYVTGIEGNTTAKYWKNSVAVYLPSVTDGVSRFGHATAIALNGNDVYIAGYINDKMAAYWKNGIPTILPGGTYASAIAVKGNDVYTAGLNATSTTVIPTYWKNTTVTSLANDYSQSYDLALSGNDVYVTFGGHFTTKYWKNGVTTIVAGDNANITDNSSIAVYNNDVYVAATQFSKASNLSTVARYWKNGVPVTLTDSTHNAAIAKIIVQ